MKLFLCALTITICLSAAAQVKVGLFAGPQITSARYTINGIKQSTDYKYSLQVGAGLKVPFEGHLYFAPALYYSMKGYKVAFNNISFPPDSNAVNNNTRIHTIEAAPLFQIDFSNKPSHVFIQIGPALDFVISGREQFTLKNGQTVNRKMQFSIVDHYGIVTASGIVHLGYQAKNGLTVFAHYTYGIGSADNTDLGPIIQHREMGISIGKYWGK